MYRLRIKTWLLEGDRFLLSEGRAELLRLIDTEKSLLKAAGKIGMSYRHAWGTVREIEEALGKKVVKSSRGGREGGRTSLTKAGRDILYQYTNRTAEALSFVEGKTPKLAADAIIVINGKIVLVRRAYPPFRGKFALPGGFLEPGERMEEAAVREAFEETGLKARVKRLVGVYSAPDRDPRGHVVSSVYELEVVGGTLGTSDEVKEIGTFRLKRVPALAFDHSKIVKDYVSTLSSC